MTVEFRRHMAPKFFRENIYNYFPHKCVMINFPYEMFSVASNSFHNLSPAHGLYYHNMSKMYLYKETNQEKKKKKKKEEGEGEVISLNF